MAQPNSQSVLAAVCDRMEAENAAQAPATKAWTAVFIVASARPLTGKTFVARLFADFLRVDGGPVEAFDLNPADPALADVLPSVTTTAGLDSTQAQMSLFDRLIVADGVPKVVDLGHTLFMRFFAVMQEIGFVEAARRRAIETVVLYAADPHPASAKAYAVLQRRFPAAVVVPVFNESILKGRKVRDDYEVARAAAVPLQIPVLPPGLKAHADRSGNSFADFHGSLPVAVPFNQALDLRSWTKRVFLEFREFELRLLLDKLRASLR